MNGERKAKVSLRCTARVVQQQLINASILVLAIA
jgi:hypothetical protein